MTDDHYRRLVGHIDKLEGRLDRDERALSQVKAAVMKLAAAAAADQPAAGQRDWIATRDAAKAEEILIELLEWMDTHGAHYGFRAVPCWPWHPFAVVLILAAADHQCAAYKGGNPSTVTDYLIRYLPALATQLGAATGDCDEYQHYIGRAPYVVHLDRIPDLAIWWAADREGLPPGVSARTEGSR